MTENEIATIVIVEAIKVHKALGPGMLEKVYAECLYYELRKRKIGVLREVPLPVIYEGVKLACGYRADMIVENKVVVEIKSVEQLADVHLAQTLTYLKFGGCKL